MRIFFKPRNVAKNKAWKDAQAPVQPPAEEKAPPKRKRGRPRKKVVSGDE